MLIGLVDVYTKSYTEGWLDKFHRCSWKREIIPRRCRCRCRVTKKKEFLEFRTYLETYDIYCCTITKRCLRIKYKRYILFSLFFLARHESVVKGKTKEKEH